MSANTIELMNRGMRCLTEQMGIVEAEQFISIILREKFDYTTWQRTYFDTKSPDEISKEAADYAKKIHIMEMPSEFNMKNEME